MHISVPKIIKSDLKKGNFLIEDFGINSYKNFLKKKNEYKLYNLAVDNLLHINKSSKKIQNKLPKYTNIKFIEESLLFLKWYWPAVIGTKAKKEIFDEFINIWNYLLTENLKTKKVLVHRDFHIDNLFFLQNRKKIKACGLIDFQDALIGPSSYDLMSLLEDARRNVNKIIILKMYKKFVKNLSTKNKENFSKEYKVLAANRHLKVIGIFTRLSVRDKKKNYLKHIPRLWRLLENNLEDNSLFKLNNWINKYFPKKFRIVPKVKL